MRILITGSRHWTCPELARHILDRLIARYGRDLTIVDGGARGVDFSFRVAARDLDLTVETVAANWWGLGPSAGPRRNTEMVFRGADLCIAVHHDLAGSRGTKDCARQAIAAGIPTWLVSDQSGDPVRLSADDARLR